MAATTLGSIVRAGRSSITMLELVKFQKLNRTYVQLVFRQHVARLGKSDKRPATGMPLFVIKLPIVQAG